jgi:ubiquinone/menaquinone biosynthesis C-methylase UbiE
MRPTRPTTRLKTDSAYDTDPLENAGSLGFPPMIHRTATAFDSAADVYESSRPGYPAEAVEWLASRLRLGPDTTLVDLAAGTGKLTRLLAPLAGRTIAVEPVEGMRAKLASLLPEVSVFDGTAEAMPLDDDSVDAVTVAQAFHWFDAARAAAEIHRVLKPGGRLAILWNRRDFDDPAQAGMEEILARYRRDTPSHRSSRWREGVESTGLLREVASVELPFTYGVSREGLVKRIASTSFIAALPDGDRDEVLTASRALAARFDEPIALPHMTEIHCFEA